METIVEQKIGSNGTTTDPITTAGLIRQLQKEMNELFPEREALITQLVYALLTREHVLVHGVFGTGKSLLVKYFFGVFADADFFSIELTKFMTESNVIGIPNPKKMRESGEIFHERKGTMLEAEFAELDELFDANDHLLRTLLGILNERRFNRGIQLEKAELHSALASTNADPEKEIKRSPTLGAVVDRFLFQTEVKYLSEDASRRRMYEKYLSGGKPSVTISYHSLNNLVDTVMKTPFQDQSILIDLYNTIVQEFQKKKGVSFSDRRTCQALKLAQANAVLYGRDEVVPDDLLAVMWAFVKGEDTQAQKDFEEIAKPLIEKAVKNRKPDIIRTQMQLFNELEDRFSKIQVPNIGKNATASEAGKLVELMRLLVQLDTDVTGVAPSHVTIEDRKKKLLSSIGERKKVVQTAIEKEGGI